MAIVEEHGVNATSPDKAGVDQLAHVVTIQMDRGGVHGDQRRDVLVSTVGALDDVVGPIVIMVASTTLKCNILVWMKRISHHFPLN